MSGWGIYIEVYGNNACFLTPHSELYYSVIYLNGTSMNIEQKTFVQQVEPPLWRIPVRKYSRSKRHYPTSVLERRRIRANSQGKNNVRITKDNKGLSMKGLWSNLGTVLCAVELCTKSVILSLSFACY